MTECMRTFMLWISTILRPISRRRSETLLPTSNISLNRWLTPLAAPNLDDLAVNLASRFALYHILVDLNSIQHGGRRMSKEDQTIGE